MEKKTELTLGAIIGREDSRDRPIVLLSEVDMGLAKAAPGGRADSCRAYCRRDKTEDALECLFWEDSSR